jgi:hypothetical protein
MFYNDGYVPILGVTKHPGWLGRSGRECWSEIWPIVGPMLDSVFVTGEATWSEDLLLVMRRNLSREENYFNSPTAPFATMMGRSGGFSAPATRPRAGWWENGGCGRFATSAGFESRQRRPTGHAKSRPGRLLRTRPIFLLPLSTCWTTMAGTPNWLLQRGWR